MLNPQINTGIIDAITPLIITFDEAPNIARTLEKLSWARRIVVIDSGSTDGTQDILKRFPQVECFSRTFDTFAKQCNFGLTQIKTEWVLSLDADYELSSELVQELHDLREEDSVVGYRASFVYRIYGRPLRGTLYPPRVVLHRAKSGSYKSEGHGHRVRLSGKVLNLQGVIYHDDRKPLSRWMTSQLSYARVEADYLLSTVPQSLPPPDRMRRMAWPVPLLIFPYVLFAKLCILDGWPGWYYALQRFLAEAIIALEIIDRKLRRTIRRHDRE